jgi:serine/threonine-protein kinase
MHEPVTLVRAIEGPTDEGPISAALPPDLLAQVRRRVRVLAILLLIGFGFDLVIWVGRVVMSVAEGDGALAAFPGPLFQWTNAAGVLASAAMWWVAGRERISASRLLTLGQAYEIVICLAIALSSFAQHFQEEGVIPHVTWVMIVVILFPLLLPGPPRRILLGAIAAAAMAPLSLWLLHATGQVLPAAEDYVSTVFSAGFAVMFATVGANVVYGLGREVVAARRAGSYQLVERLGAGGMGEVWRARHRMLARPAAIKLIRRVPGNAGPGAGRPSSELLERFEREAQVIAGLRSPHTVDLFDFGVADDGAFYYAMELLDGLDAETLVRRFGPLPAERAVHLLLQVCHSLSEAHARGLVHRDIKPGNVFVCRYGEEVDFVKVLDFGIVKELDRPNDDPALTTDDAIRGTPAFLAPEQAMGEELDGRCDLYAVGCLAYWLLTGTRVFEADTTVALLMHHLKSEPAPPSARTELPIPDELDQLVLSCLSKDPEDRPASARDLADRLRRVPVAAAWSEERAREWWALHQPPEPGSGAHPG